MTGVKFGGWGRNLKRNKAPIELNNIKQCYEEQIFLEKAMVGGCAFMKEGQIVEVVFDADEENPLTCDVPSSVVLEITYTEPGEKGNTATNALKPATVETGATVNVPLFINEGDKIKIDTVKGAYQERVKA